MSAYCIYLDPKKNTLFKGEKNMNTTILDASRAKELLDDPAVKSYRLEDRKMTRRMRKELKKNKGFINNGKGEHRLVAMAALLEGDLKAPVRCDVMTREVQRNIFRAKYGNRRMQNPWMNMRVRDLGGLPGYIMNLRTTDPKKRHNAVKFQLAPTHG